MADHEKQPGESPAGASAAGGTYTPPPTPAVKNGTAVPSSAPNASMSDAAAGELVNNDAMPSEFSRFGKPPTPPTSQEVDDEEAKNPGIDTPTAGPAEA